MPRLPPSAIILRFLLTLCMATVPVTPSIAANIAWFYALEEDRGAFAKLAGPPLRSLTHGASTLHFYQVGPHRICAVRMGSGCMVTATAAATCLAIFPADRVISTGPAGGLTDAARPGTWHLAGTIVAWQKGRAENSRIVPSDSAVTKLPAPVAAWPTGDWQAFPHAKVASGEAFVASTQVRDQLARDTGCTLVEMNAAGLVSALSGHPVPCLILRVVSDRANESASTDFAAFVKSYDGKGGILVHQLAKVLRPDPARAESHDALRKLLEGVGETEKQDR